MSHQIKTLVLALATALPTTALADWNGGYAGLALGPNLTNEISAEESGVSVSTEADDSISVGAFGGFNVQNGDFVFGGEVAFSSASDLKFEFEGEEFETDYDIFDLKGRAGYAVDNIMFYGVVGYSIISDEDDEADGFSFGAGAEFDLGNNFAIGAEYLARRAVFDGDDGDVDIDLDLDTLAIRGSFSF